jgi:hypothetical protein
MVIIPNYLSMTISESASTVYQKVTSDLNLTNVGSVRLEKQLKWPKVYLTNRQQYYYSE